MLHILPIMQNQDIVQSQDIKEKKERKDKTWQVVKEKMTMIPL